MLLNNIKALNTRKSQPPKFASNPSAPDPFLEKDLGGKTFQALSDEQKNLIYSDITVLNPEAFRYYLFDLFEDSLEREELPTSFFMLILGLSKESVTIDERMHLLTHAEKKMICAYMKYIADYIAQSDNIDAIDLRDSFQKEIKQNVDFWCGTNK